ncbi:MAG TPA: hypothetical protein PK914_10945, partial [Smithellaceae bacterium]|nr:hypothetical protein [Smithellaceae bacterium]
SDAGLDMNVLSDINKIIEINKVMFIYLHKSSEGYRNQQDINNKFLFICVKIKFIYHWLYPLLK